MPYKKRKIVPIDYTSRDFVTIKEDLLDHVRRYYPDVYKDFNEASFGSLMIDTVAYVGDILSFYLDYQVNESFLDSALEYGNILRLSKQYGYKFQPNPSSSGLLSIYIVVPAAPNGMGPDPRYIPVLQRGSTFSSQDGVGFTLEENVDFKDPNNEVIVATANSSTGLPTGYAIKARGLVVSGLKNTEVIEVGPYRKFPSFTLADGNISDILSITDEDGAVYHEVEHLTQNVVYKPVANRGDDRYSVPNILKPFVAIRRFTVEHNVDSTTIQFGAGSEDNLNTDKIIDPTKVILDKHGKEHISDKSFDPSILLQTDKMGVAPANTTLRVVYRANTMDNVNVGVGALTGVNNSIFVFENPQTLNQGSMRDVISSTEVENEAPMLGDVTAPTSGEVKQRAYGMYTSQNRAVTLQDYKTFVYNMPQKFGAVKRCNIIRDLDENKRNLNLFIVSESPAGFLTSSTNTLKRNLRNWLAQYKMMNDSIDILDARVVNIGVEFEAIADLEANKHRVLTNAIAAIRSRVFKLKYDIGEPLRITDIYSALKNVEGLLDVANVRVRTKTGAPYSDVFFNIDENTSADGRIVIAPQNVVFELKYPESDIVGTVR